MSKEELTDTQEMSTDNQKKEKKSNKKNKLTELQEQLDQVQQELSEAKDKYIRLYAEFDNYKKRTIKERLDLISTASRETISSLLPVIDDFDRAKKSADDENSAETFSEGVLLVYNKFKSLLQARGLKAMESTGAAFDPDFHEALTEIPAPSVELKGKVLDTVENGYLLNDKIIRHAKVVVGK